jgi:EAL domain-containing protein (putative c-di-GMP-specific phosphodiesterase class I)
MSVMTVSGEYGDTIPVSGAATAAGTKTVLVVDDDESVARTLRRVLEASGFDVSMASDGATAANMVVAQSFDVILSDIQMPQMSGVDLLRVVRAYDLDVPVILMTGDPKVETAIEAVSLGALQYLVKPTPNAELVRAVERASQLHRMARMKRDALKLVGDGGRQAGDRAGLEASFDRALQSLWMAFQPIVDVPGRRVFGYEALMRSRERSLPHPGAVLNAAERLGRLPELGRRVRELSAEAFESAPKDALLFVNLHTLDLLDPLLFEDSPLRRMADRVVLEITERSTIDDVKDVRARVSVLRYHGFRIAIDDLGAGYAGLSSFAALEPEIVKLDMSLVRGVHTADIKKKLVRSMTTLCREMGIRVVAEGVEVKEEGACLRELGCDLLQGYLFARPGPAFPAAAMDAARALLDS